jgi:2-polyprenyl-3-methyl-5-hydroxy-6-metoxy-1,4-benzoquinol methylase
MYGRVDMRMLQWILSFMCERWDLKTPVNKLLDVGIAYGTLAVYTRLTSGNTTALYGADYPGAALSDDMKALMGIRMEYMNAELNDFPDDYTGFDAAILTETIEHFNYHPLQTLQRIRVRMNDGSALFVSTPASPSGAFGIKDHNALPHAKLIPRDGPQPEYVDGHV